MRKLPAQEVAVAVSAPETPEGALFAVEEGWRFGVYPGRRRGPRRRQQRAGGAGRCARKPARRGARRQVAEAGPADARP